jgi:hypothetical protein
MDEKTKKEKELIFYKDTELKLNAGSINAVLGKLKELHKTGNVAILPLVLNLLDKNQNEEIAKEVFILLNELKDSKSVPVIVNHISKYPTGKYFSKLIASCWQSGLDFSSHLAVFVNCFIEGNYEVALESFTVIEEMVWRTPIDKINICRKTLADRINEISEEKKPLHHGLIKILDEGISINIEEFPDLYLQ